MALDTKYQMKHTDILRDARPWTARMRDNLRQPSTAAIVYIMAAIAIWREPMVTPFADLVFFVCVLYFWWLVKRPLKLPFKLPKSARRKDPNFKRPDGSFGMADGILYLGNDHTTGEEIWFTNSDARTHCLYLGTTGSGKTFGLKSYACNALCWSSGFIYIDGKADTDLWSTISAMARRFGRDDDVLIMNYMTGNVTGKVPSNTLNPFSSGSASYLTNMLVSLMPDAEGDNAMWKERAVALVSALMPCLVWKRENQNIPLSIGVIRQFLTFKAIIKLSRDVAVPEPLRAQVKAYLGELPGYDDRAFDDDGNTKQQPDGSMPDTSTPNQQHGYLSMQFTRSMQSLGDDYGFIFDTPAADIDMLDVVLNRRILIVLIPALEKSGDETANLGKIIASTLKGMMGATLGNTVEGDTATAIENKPTTSSTPFIAIFDEVGYYTSQGMAVMAAQARSLGFSLVFAGQDLPALEKRVKEEARSITANCNIKLFGKLEDPTQTKEFFEKTVGKAMVTEVSGYARAGGGKGYNDSQNASVQVRDRASYEGLKGFNEGRAICAFGDGVTEMQVYNSDIGHAKAMRVHRFLPIPPPSEEALDSLRNVDSVLRRLRNRNWNPAQMATPLSRDIEALAEGFMITKKAGLDDYKIGGITGVANVAAVHQTINPADAALSGDGAGGNARALQALSEAERTAAAVVAAKSPGGPLNWMEVIGIEADGATGAGEADDGLAAGGISWDAIIGDMAAGPGGLDAGAATREAARGALSPLPGPISWGDVIGMLPAAEAGPAMPGQAFTADDAGSDDDDIMAYDPLVGMSPASPAQEDAPANAPMPWDAMPQQPARDAAEKKVPGQPITWGDIIGANPDANGDTE